MTFILGTLYATPRTSADGAGTVLTPAGLGTGVDTIRSVAKVDPVGTLKLSSLRSAPRCASSETARAGGLMVDEVLLPILSNVCSPNSLFFSEISHPRLDLLDYQG